MVAVFIIGIYKLIKSLPNNDMQHRDFVAITNGYKIISFGTICVLAIFKLISDHLLPSDVLPTDLAPELAQKFTAGNIIVSRFVFDLFTIIQITVAMYLLGIAIAEIYAKYKRAKLIGFKPWQIILSMPFTFIMTWMPGYLNKDNDQISNIKTKDCWYERFTKWTLKTQLNTYFVFIFLILFTNTILTGSLPTFIFPLLLLLFYELWKKFCHKDFKSCINNGYAWIAIIANLGIMAYCLYIIDAKYHFFHLLYNAIIKG